MLRATEESILVFTPISCHAKFQQRIISLLRVSRLPRGTEAVSVAFGSGVLRTTRHAICMPLQQQLVHVSVPDNVLDAVETLMQNDQSHGTACSPEHSNAGRALHITP